MAIDVGSNICDAVKDAGLNSVFFSSSPRGEP
jgi:hypothetical protein